MVARVKREIQVPLIVGGGIRTVAGAKEILDAGADVIVTGTLVEQVRDIDGALRPIIDEAKRR